MKLPNSERAVVDIAKLTGYSLNPQHESGGSKARVFRAALGLTINDAEWLRAEVLRIAREGDAKIGEVRSGGMDGIKKLGMVALLTDKPEVGLRRGDVGTVVEVFELNEHHPQGCIVEFVDDAGRVVALLDVTNLSEIVPLNLTLRAA